ncbi:MAG: hypothetical protein ACFCU6_13190 [Balneolaceae bacterium]
MNDGTILWFAILVIFALIFFVIAAVVTYKGIAEIKEIMNDPELKKKND